MPRCKPEEVAQLIRDYDNVISLSIYINMANVMTDMVYANDTGSTLSTVQLTEIEKLLSAHFYSIRDTGLKEEKTADASGVYWGKTEMALDYTPYGQMAKMFDTTGYLTSLGKPTATVSWLGKPPSEQIDYVDRD